MLGTSRTSHTMKDVNISETSISAKAAMLCSSRGRMPRIPLKMTQKSQANHTVPAIKPIFHITIRYWLCGLEDASSPICFVCPGCGESRRTPTR